MHIFFLTDAEAETRMAQEREDAIAARVAADGAAGAADAEGAPAAGAVGAAEEEMAPSEVMPIPGVKEGGGGGGGGGDANPPLMLLHHVSARHFDLLLPKGSRMVPTAKSARAIADAEERAAETA